MCTSKTPGGWRGLCAVPMLAMLAAGGCGSGGGGAGGLPQVGPMAYAYVTSASSSAGGVGSVYQYAVMPDGSAVPLTPASIGAGVDPGAVVVGSGQVYVVNNGDGTISQYSIETNGTLTPLNPASVPNAGMHTLGVTGGAASLDPTGSALYVANPADDTLSQFGIGSDGRLTALSPATLPTGDGPSAIAIGLLGGPAVIYVVNAGAPGTAGSVSQFSEAVGGALTPSSALPVAAGINPSAMAVDGAHSTAYVASNCEGAQCSGLIRQFSAGAGDGLTDTGVSVSLGSHYRSVGLALDAVGANAYVLTNEMGVDTLSGALWHYTVGSAGALTVDAASPLAIGSVAVAMTRVDQYNTMYLLTTNSGASANQAATGGSLIAYDLSTGGGLTQLATTPLTAPNPASIGIWVLLPP